ncbi:Uncharacterised protein [Mycobacteroides abscessus subsp. abscessus]|nr:Uncharacterised protein [Mycobacteroides abscessus subsp. abscessus]
MWVLRCSVRSTMRLVNIATCASGEPVSVSCSPYWARISFFCSGILATKSTATCWPYRSAVVSRMNASTVRAFPEKVGLLPTETAA